MRRLLALLALIALSAVQVLLTFEVAPGLRPLLLIATVTAGLATVLVPWRWTLTLAVAWPFAVDPAATLRIVAGETALLAPLSAWASTMAPYPLFLTLLAVTALVWGWRLWFEGRRAESPPVSPMEGLAWVWIGVALGGALIGLAMLNPLGQLAMWFHLIADIWRWPVLAGVDRFHPVSQAFAVVVTAGFFLALHSQMNRQGEGARGDLMRAVIVSGILVALVGLIQHLDPSRLVVESPTWIRDRRITGPLRDPNTAAILLAATLVMMLPWIARRWEVWPRSRRLWAGAGGVAVAPAMMLTGSRAIWFAVPMALLIWWAIRPRTAGVAPRPRLQSVAALPVALLALASLLWSSPPIGEESRPSLMLQRLDDTITWGQASDDPALRTGLAGRPHHWRTGWAMIEDRPLLGQGFGTTLLLYDRFRAPDSPFERQNLHNQFLQVWAELGLPGLITLMAILAVGLLNRAAPIGPRLALLVFALAGLTGHPLVLPEMHLLLWLLLALCSPAARPESRWSRPRLWAVLAALPLLLGAASAVRIARSQPEPTSGLYEVFQADATEVPFLWTRGVATLRLDVESAHLLLPVRAGHPDVRDRPVEVTLSIDGEPLRTERLSDHDWHLWILDLRPWMGETVSLAIRVDRTWTPLRFLGIPDARDLALALGPWRWLDAELTHPREVSEPWPTPSLRFP